MQHFYPHRAETDKDEVKLAGTLRWTAVELKGGHGSVAFPEPQRFAPHALCDWIQGKLVITLGTGARGETLRLENEPWGERGPRRAVEHVCDARFAARRDPRPDKIAELMPGIRYVDWRRISIDDFTTRLGELDRARGIVFDVRGHPAFQDPVTFFGHLLPNGGTSRRWHVPVLT